MKNSSILTTITTLDWLSPLSHPKNPLLPHPNPTNDPLLPYPTSKQIYKRIHQMRPTKNYCLQRNQIKRKQRKQRTEQSPLSRSMSSRQSSFQTPISIMNPWKWTVTFCWTTTTITMMSTRPPSSSSELQRKNDSRSNSETPSIWQMFSPRTQRSRRRPWRKPWTERWPVTSRMCKKQQRKRSPNPPNKKWLYLITIKK